MKKYIISLVIVIFLLSGFLLVHSIFKEKEIVPPINEPIDVPDNPSIEIKSPEEQYAECMSGKDPSFEERFVLEMEELSKEFSKYNVSVLYNNLLDDHKIMYNEKENYYSASTVKPAVALYYYEMAIKGSINLEEKVIFSEKYWNDSMTKRLELNGMYSLRTLLKYSMTYSDNGAHRLLIERIGYKTLNNYIKETIGPENTFLPNGPYGRINAIDGNLLINKVYRFIEENDELGKELKGYMINSIMKTLKIDGIDIAQKYGWWEEIFHVIGIVYDEYPYTLVVLTEYGENKEFYGVIDKINKKVSNFHSNYINKKVEFCSSKIIIGPNNTV